MYIIVGWTALFYLFYGCELCCKILVFTHFIDSINNFLSLFRDAKLRRKFELAKIIVGSGGKMKGRLVASLPFGGETGIRTLGP